MKEKSYVHYVETGSKNHGTEKPIKVEDILMTRISDGPQQAIIITVHRRDTRCKTEGVAVT